MHLTLPTGPCIYESCSEIKIKLNFSVHTSLWCLFVVSLRLGLGRKGLKANEKIGFWRNLPEQWNLLKNGTTEICMKGLKRSPLLISNTSSTATQSPYENCLCRYVQMCCFAETCCSLKVINERENVAINIFSDSLILSCLFVISI